METALWIISPPFFFICIKLRELERYTGCKQSSSLTELTLCSVIKIKILKTRHFNHFKCHSVSIEVGILLRSG